MPSTKGELEIDWDLNVLEFWDATLSSFKRCHEAKEQYTDSKQVTEDLLKNLPLKQQKSIKESATTVTKNMDLGTSPLTIFADNTTDEAREVDEENDDEEAEEEQLAVADKEYNIVHGEEEDQFQENERNPKARSEHWIEEIDKDIGRTKSYSEKGQTSRSKRKAAAISATDDESCIRMKPSVENASKETEKQTKRSKKGNDADREHKRLQQQLGQQQYNDLSDNSYYQQNDEQQYAYTNPDEPASYAAPMPPPPPTKDQSEDSALSNLMMAWYYAGYYTAVYQSRREFQR
ncbi:hypothetical protein BDF20DRAFT_844138 [Mycotypha africana]|uniref:uncharacterized protein n=1 Tax=Mycotypha africana TaxID=64632 RepID=UPI002300980B|nr:uncharacterized protein BDF20DRAFT_844138 [Mycotypha africana]KAI8991334.1 hypothetical protein BDF20DRAFT_844138 [Mycotypha africana]